MNRRLTLADGWNFCQRTRAWCLAMLLCSLPAVGVPGEPIVQSTVQSTIGQQIGTTDSNTSVSIKTILVIGDSLSAAYGLQPSQGWVNLLQARISAKHYPYKVVNASISGETTQGGASRIQHLLTQFTPDIILLELGGNDGLRGLPIKTIRQSLETIIATVVQKQIRLILLGMRLPPNYGIQYTQQFEDLYPNLAAQHKTQLVPFLLQGFASDLNLIQADGIHPKAEAQVLILDNVWPVLEPLL